MNYRHVTTHNGRYTWQLNILGYPCRTSAHFNTAEEAAVSVDLVKFYLRTEFKLDLPESLDGDAFSDIAYSHRHVDLSSFLSVLKSIPEDVRDFLARHKTVLEAHRESAPPETVASKFRRSGMIEIPAVREWVEKLELAEMDSAAFALIDSANFFLRLSVVEKSLIALLKSLGLATRMHASATNPRLVARMQKLVVLSDHMKLNLEYVKELTADLRAEQASVERAVATLEAQRPSLV